jgi:hypothetical protein
MKVSKTRIEMISLKLNILVINLYLDQNITLILKTHNDNRQ